MLEGLEAWMLILGTFAAVAALLVIGGGITALLFGANFDD